MKNIDKYLHLIKLNSYHIDIIDSITTPSCSSKDYIFNNHTKEFIKYLSTIDCYNLSVSEAFALIENITSKAKDLLKHL